MKTVKWLVASLAMVFAACVVPMQGAWADAARVLIVSKTIDLASQADGVGSSNSVTVPGAALGDACIASASVDISGMSMTCYISAANTAIIRVQNESAGTLDLASATFRVFLMPKGSR